MRCVHAVSPQSSGGNCRAANCTDKYSIQLTAKSGQGQRYLNFYRQRAEREKYRSHLGAQDQSHVNISALERRSRRKAGGYLYSSDFFKWTYWTDVVT